MVARGFFSVPRDKEKGTSMSEELVTVETFWNVSEAHLAKALLQEAGIQTFLENENAVMMTPHLADPCGVRLLVKQKDAEQAREFLKTRE